VNKNIRYVDYKNEAERSRLIEEYSMYGYYVTEADGRIVVNSKWPKKPTKKKGKNERVRQERSDRD
jgi:hypothetical protein